MGTGPDLIIPMLKRAILLCAGYAHREVKPFLLVRFLCGFPKKMNPAVGPGSDGLAYSYSNHKHKTVGTLPDRRLAFFAWPKESQQRKGL